MTITANLVKEEMVNKGMFGMVSPITLGAAGLAIGVAMSQTHDHEIQGANRRITPRTPEQKAILDQRRRLTAVAVAALDEGRFTDAGAAARQSLSLGAESGVSEEVLALALNAQGKSAEALLVYKANADRGSLHSRILLPYALLLLRAGRWAEAVDEYNKQLPYLAFGDRMRAAGEFSIDTQRTRDLETAIHIGLGLVYISSPPWGRHSQNDKAVTYLQQALVLEPDSPLTNYYYGFILKRLGRSEEAQAAFAKAAQLGGEDVKAAVKRFSP